MSTGLQPIRVESRTDVPLTILRYWVIGAIIASAGYAVYAEFATAIPRNGGELNYLQQVYRKPKYFVGCVYGAQALLLGQGTCGAFARVGQTALLT